MRFEDLKEVFDLGEALFTADDWPILYRTWDEYEIMERFISDEEYCLVAEIDGKIVGFLIGSMIKKRRSRWIYGYVIWMGVAKDFQHLGVGKKMFQAISRRFKKEGVTMLMVDTSAENDLALAFFQKNGFSRREEHVFLFKNLSK